MREIGVIARVGAVPVKVAAAELLGCGGCGWPCGVGGCDPLALVECYADSALFC